MSAIADGAELKVYVTSGNLMWVGMARSPLEAVTRALDATKNTTLDADNFYIDQRGYRTADAEWVVSVEKGLAAAGYEDVPEGSDDF